MKATLAACLFSALSAAPLAAAPDAGRPVLPAYLQGIGIDQRLNAQTPLGAEFRDETGRTVRLGDLLGRRPAILALVYYRCTMLCDQILNGIVRGLRPLSLQPGRDFDVIAISINPAEDPPLAAAKRQNYVRLYSKTASTAGWHFLTGSEPNIRAVADAVGYHYRYEPKTGIFLHLAGIMVLTPEGKAARYLYGVEYEPKDLKLSLVEASHDRIGSLTDQILLFCCPYDPVTGKYTASVLNLMRVTAGAFLVLLIAVLAVWWRRDLRFHCRAPVREQST